MSILTRFSAGFLILLMAASCKQQNIALSTIDTPAKKTLEFSLPKIENLTSVTNYGIIQFKEIPTDSTVKALKNNGVELLNYIPTNSYYAKVEANKSVANHVIRKANVSEFLWLEAKHKLDPQLSDAEAYPSHIIKGDQLALNVILFSNTLEAAKIKIAPIASIEEVDEVEQLVSVLVPSTALNDLASLPEVRYIEPVLPEAKAEDIPAMTLQRGNYLKTGGLDFEGENIVVAVGDVGTAGTHIDYQNRVIYKSAISEDSHATHVTGIVAGAGNLNPIYQGQAPKATVFSYHSTGSLSSSAINGLVYSDSMRITTHSLGWTCNGGYDASAARVDRQIVDYPSLMHIFSAGNSGADDCGQYPTGWGNITGGYKQGKNVIAVANLTDVGVVSNSSSRGPAKDGRIKPDIAATGSSVMSTQDGNTYSSKSGTSMAAPAVAGTMAQLFEAYRSINGVDPKGGLIKGIVLNSADDAGNVGPDFKYGWGIMNARKAYNVMKNNTFITGSLSNGQNKQHQISVPAGTKEAKIMVYWTDPAGVSGSTVNLVNDLDMTVSNGGTTHKPWQLGVSEINTTILDAPATKGSDHTNNVEQVVITDPSGLLTVNVSGVVTSGTQEYFVIYEFTNDEIVVTYPKGGEKLANGESIYVRWDAYGSSGTFDIEFSADKGQSWSTVATGIAGNVRHYSSWGPNFSTKEGLVRVKRSGSTTGVSTVFTVFPVPGNLTVDWACQNKTYLKWDEVNNASGYTIYALGTKFMDSIATSVNTNHIVSTPDINPNYYAVSAKIDGENGRRTIAVYKAGGVVGNCPNGADLFVDKVIAPTENLCLVAGQNQTVSVVVGNAGSQTINSYTINYKLGTASLQSEIVNQSLAPGQTDTVVFSVPFVVPASGIQTLSITSSTTGDVDLGNNNTSVSLDFSSGILSLPLVQNFDGLSTCAITTNCEATNCNFTGWITNVPNGTDEIDWRVDNNGTASTSTGPSGDHTSGSGKYVYLEGSTCYEKLAVMETGCIDLVNESEMTFWYNMYGSTMGSMNVSVIDGQGNNAKIEWSKQGDQGTNWTEANVDLSAYKGQKVKLKFSGTTGTSWYTDMAIDDINIKEKPAVADFTANSLNPSNCDTVTFTSTSTGTITSYAWNFGANAQPSSANTAGPHKVVYNNAGTSTVSLTINGNNSETKNNYITSSNAKVTPSAAITFDNSQWCDGSDAIVKATVTNGGTPTYSWLTDANGTSNTDSIVLKSAAIGDTVKVQITSSLNCVTTNTVSSNTIVIAENNCVITGLNGIGSELISIYPNPFSSQVIVEMGLSLDKAQFEVYDLTGKILVTGNLNAGINAINLSSFEARGMYLLKICDANGCSTHRITKN